MTSTDTEHVLKHTIPSTTISGPPAAWLSLALATQLLPNVGAKDADGTKKNCTLVIPGLLYGFNAIQMGWGIIHC